MATTRKNTRTNTNTNKNGIPRKPSFESIPIMEGWSIQYRDNEWGLFALEHGDAIIYGCKLITGSNGLFIGFPNRQGSNGKYYNHARFTSIPYELADLIADAIGFAAE